MRDFFDRQIEVGDRIVYAVRYGNTARMCSGTVLEVDTGRIQIARDALHRWEEDGRKVWLTIPERITVIS